MPDKILSTDCRPLLYSLRKGSAILRKLIKTTAGWIHTTLILAIIIPLLYALCVKDQAAVGPYLYLKCLVILFPVVVTDLAADKCRNLLSYLFFSALTLAATGAMGWVTAGSLRNGFLLFGYMLLLAGETLFVIVNRLTARLQKKKEREAALEADPSYHPFYDILKEPAFPVLFYFGAVYVLALNFNSPSVCNAALFSAVLYALITFLYHYIYETDRYLALNKRTCSLPSRRIYGIGSGMLAIYLALLMALTLPSLLTIANRHYRDLRELKFDVEIEPMEMMSEPTEEPTGEDPMAILMEQYGDIKPAPWWLDYIFYGITIVIFAVLILALIKKVYSVFQDFRAVNDENGDIVEELQDTDDIINITAPLRRRKLSERERIRREYRKVIRRHRKDRPAVYESPAEIEQNAGIAQTEDGMALHDRYETARYAQGADV